MFSLSTSIHPETHAAPNKVKAAASVAVHAIAAELPGSPISKSESEINHQGSLKGCSAEENRETVTVCKT